MLSNRVDRTCRHQLAVVAMAQKKPDPKFADAAEAEGVKHLTFPVRISEKRKAELCIDKIDELNKVVQRLHEEKKQKTDDLVECQSEIKSLNSRRLCVKAWQISGQAYRAMAPLGSQVLSLTSEKGDSHSCFQSVHVSFVDEERELFGRD